MNIITHFVMWSWIPTILYLFMSMQKYGRKIARKNAVFYSLDNKQQYTQNGFGGHGILGLWSSNDSTCHSVIIAFIASWLFLPVARYNIPVLPDYTKMSATCIGVLLAAIHFDFKRLAKFRFSIVDLPMLLWIIAPFISSLTNGLGLWDGLAALFQQIVSWGMPYFIGRVYINTIDGLHDLARGIFYGGLVYIPLCLLESRISPQLHRIVYGFMAHYDFSQTYRMGGWRPMVFMSHGLMVGVWMMAVTINGYWMYRTGALNDVKQKLHLSIIMPILYFTMIWIRAFGAVMLLVMGLVVIIFSTKTRLRIVMLLFLILPPIYIFSAVSSIPLGQVIVDAVSSINTERAASLAFRVDNEHILVEKAMQQPIFGWGGWGRARVYNHLGEDISVTDSLWIIVLGNYGVFGLFFMSMVFFLPVFLFLIKYKPTLWRESRYAPVASLSVMLALYAVDNLINAMENPIFIFVAGALSGTMISKENKHIINNVHKMSNVIKNSTTSKKIRPPRFL